MPSNDTARRQDFSNHPRFFPLYHYLASPAVALLFVHVLVGAVQEPTLQNWLFVLYAAGLVAAVLSSRIMALTVQNRVIRLEMRLRLRELLPAPLVARIGELHVRQLVALRFAGDAELPALVERTLAGEFQKPKEIKAAIRDWQPDFLRV